MGKQREAHDEIVRRARVYFAGGWQELPVLPKWASLIAGPSGSGKTTIAAMAAATLSKEMAGAVSTLVLTAPSWIPIGAHNRGAQETLGVIAAHIARNDKTILVLDELDKLISGPGGVTGSGGGSGHVAGGGGDSWQSYVRAELYTVVLDGRLPPGIELPCIDDNGPEISFGELERRLKYTVFVVGIGTFQSWFDSAGSRRSMGFGAEVAPSQEQLTAGIVAQQMPRELSNRFHSSIIRLPELQAEDYHRLGHEIETKLPLRMQQAFRAECQARLTEALEAKQGMRFYEDVIMEVLKIVPPEPTLSESQIETNPGPCML